MNAKKILVMIFVLSLLVAGGIMQISAKDKNKDAANNSAQVQEEMSESSEKENGIKAPDTDTVEEQFEGQDVDDESDDSEEEGKVKEVESDGIEFEGEEEHED